MLARLSVRRPVTVLMFYIGFMLLGVIGWQRIPQEFFPPISFPQLTIKTTYKDAAPEEIEMLITKPIEEIVGTVSGLKRISSISKEEVSLVIAELDWGLNMDFAALHVREKIDLIKERLPRGAEEPIVLKFNPFEKPILVLNVTGKRTPYRLLEICKKQIKAELEKVEGVAACVLRGGQEREILVEVNQDALQASGISITKLSEALQKSNVNFPAGTIEEEFLEYLVRSMGEFKMVREMPHTVIGIDRLNMQPGQRTRLGYLSEEQKRDMEEEQEQSKRLIYLRDIAQVKDTFKEKTSFSRFNGKDTVSISVQKQAGSFALGVVKNVEKALKELKITLPADIDVQISFDQSSLIRSAIQGVVDAGWQGALLTFVTLFLFLRSMMMSLVVTGTIFISILITFFFMYAGKVSLNMISLGGLALGIGMMVDCGIVVIENINRHRQLGKSLADACIVGTTEVNAAVWSSTLTTIAVFLPMVFVIGVVGQIFKQLAFTITVSLMVALFSAITFIPMMISQLAKGKKELIAETELKEGEEEKNRILRWFSQFIQAQLEWCLAHRFLSIMGVVVLFVISLLCGTKLDREFFPKVDQGQFTIKLTMPPGTKIDITDNISKKIEQIILSHPEVKFVTVTGGSQEGEQNAETIQTLGSHQGEILIMLKPKVKWGIGYDPAKNRKIGINDFVQKLKPQLNEQILEGGELEYSIQESEFQAAFQTSAPVVLEISGADLKKLEQLARQMQNSLQTVPGLYGIKNTIVPPSPETKIHVFKDRASQYDLTVSDISLTAQTAIKGNVSTKFKEEGKEIDIRVRLRKKDREDVNQLRRLIINSRLGVDIPLAEVAHLAVGVGPTEIKRLGQQRIVMVTANIYQRGLKEVLEDVQKLIKQTPLPTGYSIRIGGEYEQMKDSFASLMFALILSLIAVYMIMAAQFESLWQPFVIFFTVPLSIIGVVWALILTNTPVGVMVFLGVIILGGVVVDNGIVLVDFVNLLRQEEGKTVIEAVKGASRLRLRPILMTALSTVVGLIPLALAVGEGADIQQAMAITVIGGMLVATFFTLVIIPVIYVMTSDFLVWMSTYTGGLKKKVDLQTDQEHQLSSPANDHVEV